MASCSELHVYALSLRMSLGLGHSCPSQAQVQNDYCLPGNLQTF